MKGKWKKILLYILAFAMLVPAAGISGGASIMNGSNNKEDENCLLYMFKGEGYIVANKVIVIKSFEKLKKYYEDNKESYDFDKDKADARYYDIKNFRDTVYRYDDNWFKKNMLFLIVTLEASDLFYYRLKTIDYRFFLAKIVLFRDKPRENAEGKPVLWHTFLEVDKNCMVAVADISIVDKS